jgi:hypothetical protein
MIRILLFLPFAYLLSCANSPIANILKPQPEVIRNELCYETPFMKVMQVLDNGILAYLCQTNFQSNYSDVFEGCYISGDVVFMPLKKSQNDFVDEQKFILPQDKCFIADGTYKYQTTDGRGKTVRKIRIIESVKKNPDLK